VGRPRDVLGQKDVPSTSKRAKGTSIFRRPFTWTVFWDVHMVRLWLHFGRIGTLIWTSQRRPRVHWESSNSYNRSSKKWVLMEGIDNSGGAVEDGPFSKALYNRTDPTSFLVGFIVILNVQANTLNASEWLFGQFFRRIVYFYLHIICLSPSLFSLITLYT